MTKAYLWNVKLNGTLYEIQVTYKKMKSIRLRVMPGGLLLLSAPSGTPKEQLEPFLWERTGWIEYHVNEMKEKKAAEKLPPLSAVEKKEALAYLQPLVDAWYPVVAARGIERPQVSVRAMRTRFGSCSVGRGRITLNVMLLNVPRSCAEYVVLHELAHFLYPNHSRSFYDFIAGYMPDWQERERLLKQIDREAAAVNR
jgi:hypothetical protein